MGPRIEDLTCRIGFTCMVTISGTELGSLNEAVLIAAGCRSGVDMNTGTIRAPTTASSTETVYDFGFLETGDANSDMKVCWGFSPGVISPTHNVQFNFARLGPNDETSGSFGALICTLGE